MSNPSMGSRILGSLASADGAGVVRIEDRYDTDVDDLWSSITDPGRLARWYGTVEGDFRPGGAFRVHIDTAGLDATGRVEECDPPHHLRLITRETDESARAGGEEPFDEIAEATLTADGGQTVLVIEVRGLPMHKIAAYGAGWQMHAEALGAYLAGRDPSVGPDRWGELIPAYAELASGISES